MYVLCFPLGASTSSLLIVIHAAPNKQLCALDACLDPSCTPHMYGYSFGVWIFSPGACIQSRRIFFILRQKKTNGFLGKTPPKRFFFCGAFRFLVGVSR